ncbi:MAG: serine hydrolase [Planctomycetota bacterium]
MKPRPTRPFRPSLPFRLAFLLLLATALPAQVAYVMSSYHGVTSATHQAQFTTLSGQGYRMISLAVSGGLANARYSAVWQFTGGPSWVASHDMTHSQYVAQAATWSGQGYRAKLVAASGVGNDVVMAAMWVADGANVAHFHSSVTASFAGNVDNQRSFGRRLTSCAPYNRNGIDYHVMVYEPDTSGIAWGAEANHTGTEHGDAFNEYTLGHARPTFVATSDSQRYSHVWRDHRIGNWASVSGRTSAQFDADKVAFFGQGLYLTCIAASGSGSGARFGGIFQQRLTPYARSFTRTGLSVAGMDGFDTAVETLMQNNMVRNASIAVTKDGRLVYARGYTFAEPGEFVTLPTTPFRLGSISKALCGTVVHDLISRSIGGFGLGTNAISYLGISTPQSGAAFASVRRLLQHTSGMMANPDPDPFTALQFVNPPLVVVPVDENIIVRYAANQPFGAFGTYEYSNAGTTALGQVVEQATGQAYTTALRNRLFAPVGTTALYQQMARPDAFAPGEAPYFMPALHRIPSTVHLDERLLTAQYARDFWDSAGGAVASSVVLARAVTGAYCLGDDSPSLLPAARSGALNQGTAAHHVTDGSWYYTDLGNGRFSYEHNGATDGFGANCLFTTDGLCITLVTNMSDVTGNIGALRSVADAVTTWPEHDLFVNYGMPTFPRRPQLTGFVVAQVPNVSDTPLVYTGQYLDQVTAVEFGNTTITSQSQNTWHSGWFVRESPTQLRLHPPQGLLPNIYQVRATAPMGTSAPQIAVLTRATTYAVKAPDTVNSFVPFAAIVSRGPHPDLSLAILTLSTDLGASVAPGIVSLGIGNAFANLAISDARQFTTPAGAVRWDFPSIGTLPAVHFQAVVFDPFLPSPFPLPATAVETVVRLPF